MNDHEKYDKIVETIESEFRTPSYLKQKICYVADKKDAELCISARHTLGDYVLVGIIALLHSIEGEFGEICIYNDNNPATEKVGIAENFDSPMRMVDVNTSLFIQVHLPIEKIYHKLYQGKMPVACIGLSLSTLLMMEFSDNPGATRLPQSIMSELKFTHFDDLETAQENAFILIKKLTACSVAGMYYAIDHGEA